MHTVIIDECTGCDLCVEPCPVNCIEMVPLEKTAKDWYWQIPVVDMQTPHADIIVTDRPKNTTDKDEAA